MKIPLRVLHENLPFRWTSWAQISKVLLILWNNKSLRIEVEIPKCENLHATGKQWISIVPEKGLKKSFQTK